MKKIIASAILLALTLLTAPVVFADQENLDAAGAYQAQASVCDFSQGPLVGEAWDNCEQYIYEFANLVAALQKWQGAPVPESQSVIDLVNQISALNATLAQLQAE
jgi:hypothetical protein